MKKFNSPIVYLKFTVPKPTWQHIEEKINWFKPLKFYKINIKFKKKDLNRRAHDLKNQDAS
jgi:hypothetical protein